MAIVPTMQYSEAGIALTKGYEGLRFTAYRDIAGVLTIGYGHTGPDVFEGQIIDEPTAESLLRADMATAVAAVNHMVNVPLNQNQFDALCDFAFNCGVGALKGSTLLRLINKGELDIAASQFSLWVHAGGQVVAGLVRRRADEAALFRLPAL